MTQKNNPSKIINKFRKEMIDNKIPFYAIGYVTKNINSRPIIEIVVKRPEKYNNSKIIAKIPKKFDKIKVKIA